MPRTWIIVGIFAALISTACTDSKNEEDKGGGTLTYSPIYSTYSPAVPAVMSPCDGTVTSTRTIDQCVNNLGNAVDLSLCSDPDATVVSKSPAGNLPVPVTNGDDVFSCPEGDTTQTFVGRVCKTGYVLEAGNCIAKKKHSFMLLEIRRSSAGPMVTSGA